MGTMPDDRQQILHISIQVSELQSTSWPLRLKKYSNRFKGRQYDTCITLDSPDGSAWCSTKTDVSGNHIKGYKGQCPSTCAVKDCPIGFWRGINDNACYKVRSAFNAKKLVLRIKRKQIQVSPSLPPESVPSNEAAEEACSRMGARLWAQRNWGIRNGMHHLDAHLYHGQFRFAGGNQATMTGFVLKERDGVLYPHNANTGHPLESAVKEQMDFKDWPYTDPAKLCLGFLNNKHVNIPCTGYSNGIVP